MFIHQCSSINVHPFLLTPIVPTTMKSFQRLPLRRTQGSHKFSSAVAALFAYPGICVFALLLLLFCAPMLSAKHLKFTVTPASLTIKAGGTATLKLTVKIDDGWYTYGLIPRTDKDGLGPQATEFALQPSSVLTLAGKVGGDKPKQKFDQGFQITIDYYDHEATFTIPVKAASNLTSGKYRANIIVSYMVCNSQSCLPPTDESVGVDVVVEGGQASVASSSSTTVPPLPQTMPRHDTAVPTATVQVQQLNAQLGDSVRTTTTKAGIQDSSNQGTSTSPSTQRATTESQTEIAKKRGEGIWSFLWFAMGAGASALLTPCVFPMVPITVSFFTKRAEKKRGRGLRDSFAYALGIMFTFTALGFILSLLFGATGISDFAANPWVNIALALIFIVFAFNLFGAFEIPLPTMLLNRMNNAAGSGDSIGAVLLMAVTFSITSFTCTVPFVGSALIAASSGEWFYPIVGMLGFSAVFALPFVLLALFPSFMAQLR
jgi:thiol:disulfide interchange protein